MSDYGDYQNALLVLPHLRVQNANAISSSMTWGFPSITAFLGMMHALARRLAPGSPLQFRGVGVICHDFEAQVADGGYTRNFRLTRNPVLRDGSTSAIVEEGRIHLDVTLVFLVNLAASHWSEATRRQLADAVSLLVADMRIAGGSVLTRSLGAPRPARPELRLLPDEDSDRRTDFRRLRRRWLPGFALVAREDLLHARLAQLRHTRPEASVLDAWLDLSRLNHSATRAIHVNRQSAEGREVVEWVTERHDGWTVPIPVGYAALSNVHPADAVANARDRTTPFRFVESVYSIGQWVSPHRLTDVNDLLWYSQYDEATGVYRCCNDFAVSSLPDVSAPETPEFN